VAETDTLLAWQPTFAGAASEAIRVYKKGDATVQCYLAFYERQGNGRELIQNHNVIARSDDPRWRKMGERTKRIRLVEKTLTVQETDIRGPDARFVVWNWYWFPDQFTTSPVWAKVLQARASLVLHRDHAAVVVLSVPAADAPKADEDLKQFVADMLPSIRLALDRADTRP
jgi:EpsI family protein